MRNHWITQFLQRAAAAARTSAACVFASACVFVALFSTTACAWTITPRNALTINNTAVPGLSELSGVAYRQSLGGGSHELWAVQDSGNQLATLNISLAADGSLTSAAATATQSLAPGYDFEGLALGPPGSVLVAEETTPAIRRYSTTTGAALALLSMPSVFASERANFAFESLTRVPGTSTYWTANEEALSPDGPLSTTAAGTTVRLQRFSYDDAGTLALGPQYAYQVDPIHVGTTTDARTRSGLVDLVALPDASLLALERSLGITGTLFGTTLYQYESRIYRVTFDDATDTSQPPFSSGLSGQTYTPANKTLLWRGQAGGGFGQNLEGLALGPQLASGAWSILGVVDDGGTSDVLSSNTIVALLLAPPPGDYNGDGRVDAADYVSWRKNSGDTIAYETWRMNFGNPSGGGAGHIADTQVVPEPAIFALLLTSLLPASLGARRRTVFQGY